MGFLKVLDFYKGKNVLLLQGPRGPFFWRLKKDLEKAGARVFKINFNGGDWIFYPIQCTNYRGKMEEWGEFFEKFVKNNKIDVVLLFSDWRPIHRKAIEICKKRGIIVGVFEEGYIRPNHVTLEPRGVNGFSLLAYEELKVEDFEFPDPTNRHPKKVGNPFWHEVLWAVIYYISANILFPLFPYYRHHRSLYFPASIIREAIPWLRSGVRKYIYMLKERKIKERIFRELVNKYYLVPLQVHDDSQVRIHSNFKDVTEFIEKVIYSFSKNAPLDTFLVFKHHPRDRAYRDYTKFIKNLSKKYGVEDRVIYIHDAHLPTLIDNSIGVIVINSSVGMQAIDHGKPTIALGKAIYKKDGITYNGSLDTFWNEAKKFRIDRKKYKRLKDFILFYSQINGSLHKRISNNSYTGLIWEEYNLDECLKVYNELVRVVERC